MWDTLGALNVVYSVNTDVEILEESLADISSFNCPNEQPPAALRYPWVVRVGSDRIH